MLKKHTQPPPVEIFNTLKPAMSFEQMSVLLGTSRGKIEYETKIAMKSFKKAFSNKYGPKDFL